MAAPSTSSSTGRISSQLPSLWRCIARFTRSNIRFPRLTQAVRPVRPVGYCPMKPEFHDAMASGYDFPEPTAMIGAPMLGDEVAAVVHIKALLEMFNRHGLIAGATGSGKT